MMMSSHSVVSVGGLFLFLFLPFAFEVDADDDCDNGCSDDDLPEFPWREVPLDDSLLDSAADSPLTEGAEAGIREFGGDVSSSPCAAGVAWSEDEESACTGF